MNNLIFLDEQRIKKQLKVAQENLVDLRTLICEGYKVPTSIIEAAEKVIYELESQLENLFIGQ